MGAKGWQSWPFSGIDLVLWGIAGNHARWPVYQMLRDTTKEKIPAYFTGFAMEKAPALGFRAFKFRSRKASIRGAKVPRVAAIGPRRLGFTMFAFEGDRVFPHTKL